MPEPCSFDACPDEATQRVVLTAGQAASWALRPELLAVVDRDRDSEGDRAAIGLMFCDAHAAGIEREHYQASAQRLTERERRVLHALEGQALAGGATVEFLAERLKIGEAPMNKMIKRLRQLGVVRKSRYRGQVRGGYADKWMAVSESAEPPPVQPTLGLEEGLSDAP